MRFIFIVLMIYAGVCESYRILALLPYPGKSHYMVFEPVLNELSRRGHHVTVVSFFPSTTPHANRRDVSLVGLAPLGVEVVDLKDFDDATFLSRKFYNQFAFVKNVIDFNVELCQKLLNSEVFEEFVKAEGDYDVILVEHFNTNCMLGIVHNYGLPSVGLMTCAMLPWTPSRVGADDNPATFPNMLLPFTDEMTLLEMVENYFSIHFYNIWHKYAVMNEQTFLEKRLGRKLPPLEEIGKNATAVLINTHYTLNGVRVLPPAVVEVGGIHLHNKSVQPLPEDLERWVTESKDGVILFSFGSLIRGSSLPPKRLEAILKVFARLPQRIIWKWEGEDIKHLNGTEKNILTLKWLPQYDLLNHPKCMAFISHGGLLSLTEAVAAGVPSVLLPVLGDQPGNAAHAKRAGIAEVVPFYDLNEENLFEALDKVLSPHMRSRAKAFSVLWQQRSLPQMETALHFIEHAVRYGHVDHLSSHRRLVFNPRLMMFKAIWYLSLAGAILVILILYCCCCRKTKVKVKQN